MADLDAGGLDGRDGLDGLERWAAEARAREAAEARVRERWLRTQAEEGAELVQVLTALAERQAGVVVTTAAGRQLAGRLTAVGADFVTVTPPGGLPTLVALRAVAWVRDARADRRRPDPATGPDPIVGEPDQGCGPALIDVLAQAAAARREVAVHAAGVSVTGDLRAVGVDILVVETTGERPSLAYVRLDSVYEISFLDSG